jgi:hypothetical protein
MYMEKKKREVADSKAEKRGENLLAVQIVVIKCCSGTVNH